MNEPKPKLAEALAKARAAEKAANSGSQSRPITRIGGGNARALSSPAEIRDFRIAANRGKADPWLTPANWDVWGLVPECRVWEAVCLSLDIEPDDKRFHVSTWLYEGREPVPYGFPTDFANRLKVVRANVGAGTDKALRWLGGGDGPTSGQALVSLSEFARFAVVAWGFGIGVPERLRQLAENAARIPEPKPAKVSYLQQWANEEKPLAGLSRVTVNKAMALMLYRAEHGNAGVDVYASAIDTDPAGGWSLPEGAELAVIPRPGRSDAEERLQSDFIAYCAAHGVRPRNPYARFLDDWTGDDRQNATYEITISELEGYIRAYGVDTASLGAEPQQPVKQSSLPEDPAPTPAPKVSTQGKPKGEPQWWEGYGILDMAQNIAAVRHSQGKSVSKNALAPLIAQRIWDEERRKATVHANKRTPAPNTIRTKLTELRWQFKPERD